MKAIGVLTSGGDAPGMNAGVRAVVRAAAARGIKCMGIVRGYKGLIEDNIKELTVTSVCDIIQKGGTVLYSSRCPEFKTEEGMKIAIENCKKHGIEGIVVLGGDGSFRGATDLSARGIPCVGVPCTIDNDIASTEYTIGFDTALNTACELIDKLRDTIGSHDRCSVIEVMGRNCGDLALEIGIATGATSTIVPEVPFDFNVDVLQRINDAKKAGKDHFIIVVAEGVGGVDKMAKEIESKMHIDTRATVIGHIQRGGAPTVKDRVTASLLGNRAVELLSQGIANRVVGMSNNEVIDTDIFEAFEMKKQFRTDLFELSKTLNL
ncbi:MAG: 6-phosphofructokinase [Oscillospiraceae bacterium]|nr:6-phosphofructokinase [Candidatus Equicaccousia limihippi]